MQSHEAPQLLLLQAVVCLLQLPGPNHVAGSDMSCNVIAPHDAGHGISCQETQPIMFEGSELILL